MTKITLAVVERKIIGGNSDFPKTKARRNSSIGEKE